ncbi:unnamed protein product [Parascedosporium putredinis]|uniref:WD40 repeat-like protein n=1 Tax=Parascedosporium putredinis TaxID=1442378 RepID=A0A9P1H8P0_9PEZI|nr:unnamed protein product [Parascedosporium putredinis]CAI8002302.1 unnamed protein product [Parascedosporium putredinis]
MDIHRCRFLPYPPSAINAIAFSHPNAQNPEQALSSRLAIGRENGDIEIWNPLNGTWLQEKVIYGGSNRSIDGLVWVTDPDQKLPDGKIAVGRMRLFSIGSSSSITEWDLVEGATKRHATGNHGEIWCLAAQPASSGKSGSQVSRLVAAKKHQALSLAFANSHTAVVGCSDSTLRIYDTRKDGDIVSADSTGQICIWDSKTYTQTQRLQSHDSDALSLAVSADGTVIASGGMDRRTIFYKKVAGSDRWGKVWGRRYHEHDVKAMAAFESGNKSVVVSGGPDSAPVVLPMRELGLENHRKLAHLPQQPPVVSAASARFIVSWWNQEIHVWSLQRPFGPLFKQSSGLSVDGNQKLLKTIVLNTESNISSAVVNSAGTFLAVSSAASGVKAFSLRHSQPAAPADVQVSPSSSPPSSLNSEHPASPCHRTHNGFALYKTEKLSSCPRLLGGLGSYDRSITKVCFSPDSKMLATVDLAGYIDTWVSQGVKKLKSEAEEEQDEDVNSSSSSDSEAEVPEAETRNGQGHKRSKWTRNPSSRKLPKLSSTPIVLSFSHDVPRTTMTNGDSEKAADATVPDDYTLMAVTAPFDVLAFHPLKGSLTNWTRRTRGGLLPPEMLNVREVAKGVVWQGSRAWIYGPNFIFMLDLHLDPKISSSYSKKRKRLDVDSGAGNRMQVGALGPHKVYKFDGTSKESQALVNETRNGDEMDVSDDDGNDEGITTQSGELMALRKRKRARKERSQDEVVDDHQVEVALIERPHWAIDLPERYVSNKDRTYY